MIITEKDVGRKVRLRDGAVYVIEKFYVPSIYPVMVSNGVCYTQAGYCDVYGLEGYRDIVEFVDGHSTVELSEAPSITAKDDDFEDNGQFIQKVPSAESNAKRFLNMLKAQGIYELVVVTDLGEVRCKLYVEKQSEG